MILSAFALSGTAVLAEGETEGTPKLTVTASQSGNEVLAEVKLSENPGVAGIKFNLSYDAEKLSPRSSEIGKDFTGATTNLNDTSASSPVTFVWTNAADVTTEGTLIKVMFDVKTAGEASFGITEAELANADEKDVTAETEGTSLPLTGGETASGYTNVFDMSSDDISSLTDFVALTQNKVTYDAAARKLVFDAAKEPTNIWESADAKFNMPSASDYDISFKVKFTDPINKTNKSGQTADGQDRYGNLKVSFREGGNSAGTKGTQYYAFNMSARQDYVGATLRSNAWGMGTSNLKVYGDKTFKENQEYTVAVKVYDLPNSDNQVKVEAYLDGKIYSEFTHTPSTELGKKKYGNLVLTSTNSKFEITELKINAAPRDMFDAEFSEENNDGTKSLKIGPKFLYTFADMKVKREAVKIPENTKAFAALYGSDGRLKEIKVSAPTKNSIEITETLTTSENIEFKNISAGDKARVFFWDSETLKPLTDKAFEYTVKNTIN